MNFDVACVWMEKRFEGDRFAQVVPLTFGRARITVATDQFSIDDNW